MTPCGRRLLFAYTPAASSTARNAIRPTASTGVGRRMYGDAEGSWSVAWGSVILAPVSTRGVTRSVTPETGWRYSFILGGLLSIQDVKTPGAARARTGCAGARAQSSSPACGLAALA